MKPLQLNQTNYRLPTNCWIIKRESSVCNSQPTAQHYFLEEYYKKTLLIICEALKAFLALFIPLDSWESERWVCSHISLTDLPLPGDPVVVPVVPVAADEGQLLPLPDVVGPGEEEGNVIKAWLKSKSRLKLRPDWILDFILKWKSVERWQMPHLGPNISSWTGLSMSYWGPRGLLVRLVSSWGGTTTS